MAATSDEVRNRRRRHLHRRATAGRAALLVLAIGALGTLPISAGALSISRHLGHAGHAGHSRVALFGVVETPGTDSFTLVTKTHSITVTVDSSTIYVEPGVSSPAFAGLKSGLTAGVRGAITTSSTPTSPEAVTAAIIFISPTNREPTSWVVRHHGHTSLSVTGTADNLGSDGFDLTTAASVIRIHVDAHTLYFEAGVAAPNFQDVTNGETITVTGCSEADSNGQHPVLKAYALYIGTPPASPVASATTSDVGAPPNTSGGELPPGASISDVTSTSFLYTLGDHHVTVELESYTKFFLDGVTTTAASLTSPGVTVGTSGIVDPASTSADYIVDANHVYLTS